MSKSVYAKELHRFKQSEQPEGVLLVANDKGCVSIVVAWTNTTVNRRRRLTARRGTSASDRWRWLWENAQYPKADLMAKRRSLWTKFRKQVDSSHIQPRVVSGREHQFVR